MRNSRVLLLSPLPDPVGGIATWTTIIESEARRANVKIELIDTAVRNRPIANATLFSRIFYGIAQTTGISFKLVLKLIRSNINVVHICTPGDLGLIRDILLISISRLLGARAVIHFHRGKVPDFDILMTRKSLVRHLVTITCLAANRVLVINKTALTALQNKFGPKTVLLENFVQIQDIREHLNSQTNKQDHQEVRIVFVGYVIERKGAQDLASAFSMISKDFPLARLRFVGPCTHVFKESLLALASEIDRVTFTGALTSYGALEEIASADIFCLPSYAEGLPYVILEAMALSKSIIATPVGGISEALNEGAGILVNPGDVESLSRALHSLLASNELASNLGQKALEKCMHRYDSAANFRKLLRIWEEECQC